jgi:hypothetical protein
MKRPRSRRDPIRQARREEQRRQRRARWKALARRASRLATDYATLLAGSILIAVGANLFMIPNRLVSCGVTGVGTILYYLVRLPVGMVTLAISIPLFAIASSGVAASLRTCARWSPSL